MVIFAFHNAMFTSIVIYLFLLLVTTGLGLVLLWFGRKFMRLSSIARQDEIDLYEYGVTTPARVTGHRSVTRRTSSYYITYQYLATAADGTTETLTKEKAIYGSDYRNLNIGDSITVRYLPDKTRTERIEAGAREIYSPASWRVSGLIAIVLGVFLAVFGVVIVGYGVKYDAQKAAQETATANAPLATPNPSQQTATVVAIEATRSADGAMATILRDKLAPRIAVWKRVTDHTMHRVPGYDPELSLGEREIDYGYCDSGEFYTYVWFGFTSFDGYAFVDEDGRPEKCKPQEFSQIWLRNSGSLGNSWYAVSAASMVKTSP